MKITIRQYDWQEICRLIEAEETREGNRVINVPELVHDDTGNFVRFETERIGQAATVEPEATKPTKRKATNASPEHLEKMRAGKRAAKQAREAALKQETVSLVEAVAAPQMEDALLAKIKEVEAKANGHAGEEAGKLEVVAATESPFR